MATSALGFGALRHLSLGTKTASVFVAYSLIMLTVIVFLVQRHMAWETESLTRERLTGLTTASETYIHSFIATVDRDIRFLARSQPIQALANASTGTGPAPESIRHDAERLLLDFVPTRNLIYQARVLEARSGEELVRVQRDALFGLVAPGQLQTKAHRDYVQELSTLPPGVLYISAVNLNRENGVIEQPDRPTVRFGHVLTDANGSPALFIVLNVAFRALAFGLEGVIGDLGEAMLFNSQGYVLSHPNAALAMDFEHGDGTTITDLFGPDAAIPPPSELTPRWVVETASGPVHFTRVMLHQEADNALILGIASTSATLAHNSADMSRYQVIWLSFALLAIGVVLFIVFGRILVTPMRRLIDQLNGYQLGSHASVRPGRGLLDRRDEFGALARGLMAMTARAETQMTATQVAREESQRVFDSAVDAMIITTDQGVIEGFNQAAETMFGWRFKDIVGRRWSALLMAADAGELTDALWADAQQTDGRTPSASLRSVQAMRRDGTSFPAALGISDLGQAVRRRYLVIIRDMSHEVALELARSESAAKSRFLANMSHELRTPLNAVTLHAEMIADQAEDIGNTELMDDARHIQSAANHLLDLINGILDLARIESGRLELAPAPIDLDEFVDDLQAIADTLARKQGNVLDIETEGLPATVTLDRVRLRQCILNLISNSAKFTRGGTITLSVLCRPHELILKVRDTGVGMSNDELSRIFRMFEQANSYVHSTHGGSGVGLALTRTIIELMDGDIAVESEPGKGTCFTITVPLAATPDQEARAEDTPGAAAPPATAVATPLTGGTARAEPVAHAARGGRALALSAPSPLPETLFDDPIESVPCPAADALSGRTDAANAARLCSKAGCAVLIVEDDVVLLNAIGRAIGRFGLAPIKLDNGADALAFMAEAEPSIVILDLALPGLSGQDVVRAMKEDSRLQSVPIIVITALDLSRYETVWLKEQCLTIMRKGDFDLDELATRILETVGPRLPESGAGCAPDCAPERTQALKAQEGRG